MGSYHGVVEDAEGLRLDKYIAETLGLLSRSQLKSRLVSASVNGSVAKLSRLLRPGDDVRVEWTEVVDPGFVPEDIPLSVLYEDARSIVIDKPQGMVVHPARGNWQGTLANALLFRILKERSGESPNEYVVPDRAGIVHRLDKDTSGVLIAAKDAEAQEFLSAQFRNRKVYKEYLAITVRPPPAPSGRIENALGRDPHDRKRFAPVERGGKTAVTDWKVLAAYGPYHIVALRLHTGRTHQIRVHLKALGCPILGDPLYGRRDGRFPEATLMLHARRLRILLPGHSDPSLFIAGVPERFRKILAALKSEFGSFSD